MWDAAYPYLAALLPTIGILVLFYVVLRNVLAADREERKAQAQWHAAHAAADPDASGRNPNRPGHVERHRDGSGATTAASGATDPTNDADVYPTDVADSATTMPYSPPDDAAGRDKRG